MSRSKKFKKGISERVGAQIPAPYSPGCFIATVVYGSPNHYKLEFFREFRDSLLTREMGRKSVRFYYKTSPGIASKIKNRKILKKLALFLFIEPIYHLIKFFLS